MASYTGPPEEGRGRRDLTLAVAFLLLSTTILYLPSGAQSQVAAAFRATLLRPFIGIQVALAEARLRAEATGRLQAQLDSLASTLAGQAHLVEESRRLHDLMELSESAPRNFQPASVIRPGTVGSESMFLLDVGSEDGVKAGDPVIVRDGRIGLVGVIQEARSGAAIGLDWSHPEFRASAMTADGSVFGIVEPRRGRFREEDRLLLNGTPFYEHLEPGTQLLTSGLGGIYPRGIPIGVVVELAEQEAGWRKAYWLRPSVETGSITHVLVVIGDGVPGGILELFRDGGEGESSDGERPGPNRAGAPGGGDAP